MLARIPGILSAEEIFECRKALATAEWVDGRVTAGHRFEQVKRNRQLPELHPTARRLGGLILTALERSPLGPSLASRRVNPPPPSTGMKTRDLWRLRVTARSDR